MPVPRVTAGRLDGLILSLPINSPTQLRKTASRREGRKKYAACRRDTAALTIATGGGGEPTVLRAGTRHGSVVAIGIAHRSQVLGQAGLEV